MIIGNRLCVVLPAFNAALTLRRTFAEIPIDVVDDIILVDDASTDETLKLAKELGIITVAHDHNKGYGANQKTCYRTALDRGADIVIMLHPDYQYTPKLTRLRGLGPFSIFAPLKINGLDLKVFTTAGVGGAGR